MSQGSSTFTAFSPRRGGTAEKLVSENVTNEPTNVPRRKCKHNLKDFSYHVSEAYLREPLSHHLALVWLDFTLLIRTKQI